MSDSGPTLTRRRALGACAVLTLAPLAAACTSNAGDSAPDPLLALADAARVDVATAKAISAAKPSPIAAAVVKARQAQANALQAEIDRARGGSPSSSAPAPARVPKPPADQASALSQLDGSLKTAQQKAAALVPTLPRYRAGLVGSVAAGCASLRELFS